MPTQVSQEFRRVSREVGKRFVAAELKRLCQGHAHSDVCEILTDSLLRLFGQVVEGRAEPEAVTAALLLDVGRLARSSLVWALRDWLARALRLSTIHSQRGDPEERPVLKCLLREIHQPQAGAERCSAVPAIEADAPSPASQSRAARHLRRAEAYAVSVVYTQLLRVLELRSGRGVLATALGAAQALAALSKAVETMSNSSIFDVSFVEPLLQPDAFERCTGGAAVQARLSQWWDRRQEVHAAMGRAVAAGVAPPSDLRALIPAELPLVACPSGHPTARLVDAVQDAAVAYRTDIDWAVAIERWVLPALLASALVDMAIHAGSSDVPLEQLHALSLEVLARGIAATDGAGARCSPAPGKASAGHAAYSCLLDGRDFIVQLPAESEPPDDLALLLMEARYTRGAARHTCPWQAAASTAGAFRLDVDTFGYCRLPSSLSEAFLRSSYGDRLVAVQPDLGLYRWAPGVYERLPGRRAKLEVDTSRNRTAAWALAALAAALWSEQVKWARDHDDGDPSAGEQPVGVLASELAEAFEALFDGRREQASRALLYLGAEALREPLSAMLDDALAPLSECAGTEPSRHATSVACAVRLLAAAAYEPALRWLAAESPSSIEQRQMMESLLVQIEALDPLSRTPLLMNVGLGATMLARNGASAHFTLVDKVGLAYRFGPRNEWELGGFVGGFLDAIVRHSTGARDADPFWLAGAAFGVRQISPSWPLGIELHAGAALPFNLSAITDRTAFALGLSLIIPADVVFGGP